MTTLLKRIAILALICCVTPALFAQTKAAGVPAAELLKCMTTNNAKLLGMEQVRGAIAPGFYADIIAMPQSPLADTEALRGVNFVMKNGTIVVCPK